MNKITFIILTFLFISFCSMSQTRPMINAQDSVALLSFVLNFEMKISKRETDALKAISLDNIDCISCINQIPRPVNYLVPIDTFINQTYRSFEKSILWNCVRNERPMINILILPGKDFKQRELKKEKSITIYELFYLTTKPNEVQHEHEGQQTGLQFIVLNGEFRFYGLTSVP